MQLGTNLGQKPKDQPRYKNRDTRELIVFKLKIFKDGTVSVYQKMCTGAMHHGIERKTLDIALAEIDEFKNQNTDYRIEIEYI